MKPTTLTALALTLLMFLLVLLAAFVFVFQGQVSLRRSLTEEKQTVDAIKQEQAALELNHSALQEDATRMFYERATAASESVVLTEQLANTDEELATLEAESALLSQSRDEAEEERDFYKLSGPLVKIIEPQSLTGVNLGEEVAIVIVASDVVGVEAITVSVNNELLDTPPIISDQVVTIEQKWIPESGGQKRITVRAVNNDNVTSRQSAEVIVLVRTPTPQSTPTARATLTATATLEPSPTPQF
jgi:hypothetical protein